MFYNHLLIENSNVLSYFEYLKKEGSKPILALHEKNRLIIVSYEPKNLCDYADLFILTIKTIVLSIFSHLSQNQIKIESIKVQVTIYHRTHANLNTRINLDIQNELSVLQKKTILGLKKMDEFLKKNQKIC